MGWAYCGEGRDGRPIGYGVEATCDHEGCEAHIDRGLAYACGDMHGEDVFWCHRYFCGDHRYPVRYPEQLPGTSEGGTVCSECLDLIAEDVTKVRDGREA